MSLFKHSPRGRLGRLITSSVSALIIAAALLAFPQSGAHAQSPFDTKDASERLLLEQITTANPGLLPTAVAVRVAEYADGGAGDVWRVLGKLGLPEAARLASKEDLSAVMLLQWAYRSVEQSEKNAGNIFLSAFVNLVAQTVPSIRAEQSIDSFVKKHPTTRQQFPFTGKPAKIPAKAIDPTVGKIIHVIADITSSRGAGMSARGILQRKLGLKEHEVLKQIQRYGSGKNALANKLAKLPQPPQKEMLAEIALEIFNAIPASRQDPLLGETIFRWLGLKHKKFGEWFRYRDRMLDVAGAGKVNAATIVQINAAKAAFEIRQDMATMIKTQADHGREINPETIERLFFDYTKRQPRAAALWGFAVISMKQDLDFNRYIPEEAENLKKKIPQLSQSDLEQFKLLPDGKYDVEGYLRNHGAYPHNGYQEYSRKTGYDTEKRAGEYFSTPAVRIAVGGICPAGP